MRTNENKTCVVEGCGRIAYYIVPRSDNVYCGLPEHKEVAERETRKMHLTVQARREAQYGEYLGRRGNDARNGQIHPPRQMAHDMVTPADIPLSPATMIRLSAKKAGIYPKNEIGGTAKS